MWATVKSWLASAKRLVYVVVAVAVGALFLFVVPFFRRKDKKADGTITEDPLPVLPRAMQERLNQVHEEAAVARAEASVRSDKQRKELAEIRQIEDGKERRRRLAAHLRRM